MAIGVFGVFLFKLFDEVRPFGSRANEAHVAVEDVEDLRQFVKSSSADEFPYFCDARVVVRGQLGTGVFFGIRTHGTEFIDLVFFAEAADADLAVEDRAVVFEFDGDGHGDGKRQGADGGNSRDDDVHGALDGPLFDAEAQALGPKDRDVVDFLEHRAVAEDFVGTGDDVGLDFLVRAVVDDIRLDGNGNVRTDDNDVNIRRFQFFAPIPGQIHDDLLELHFELRLGTHAVVDVTAFILVAHNHDLAHRMEALFPALDETLPDAEENELHPCADDDEDTGIGKFMDDKAQGHDQEQDQEEAHGQADQDLAEAFVLNRIEAIDAEHHDRENDGNGKHPRVQDFVLFYCRRIDKQIGQDKIGECNDSYVAQ